MSQFEEGHSKTGGRQKGTPNKKTALLHQTFERLSCDVPALIIEALPDLTPDKRVDVLLALMQYLYPKRRPFALTLMEEMSA